MLCSISRIVPPICLSTCCMRSLRCILIESSLSIATYRIVKYALSILVSQATLGVVGTICSLLSLLRLRPNTIHN